MAKRTFSDKVFLTLKHKIARLDSLKTVNHLINDTVETFLICWQLLLLLFTLKDG